MVGRNGHGHKGRKAYFYYYCTTKECRLKYPQAEIEKAAGELVVQVARSQRILKKVVVKLNQRLKSSLPKIEAEKRAKELELKRVGEEAHRLLSANGWSQEAKGFVDEQLQRLGDARKHLEEGLAKLRSALSSVNSAELSEVDVKGLLEDAGSAIIDNLKPYQRKELLNNAIHRFEISDEEIRASMKLQTACLNSEWSSDHDAFSQPPRGVFLINAGAIVTTKKVTVAPFCLTVHSLRVTLSSRCLAPFRQRWSRSKYSMNEVFYNLTVEEAVKALKSDFQNGLGEEEAGKRLTEYGFNQLQEKKGVSPFTIFLGQFKDFIVWILVGAALISGFLREWVDALAIIAIVIINAILGFLQEYRAEKSLAALKKLSNPVSKVIRESQRKAMPSSKLVPGDVIEIEAGDSIPADSRLIWTSANFGVQEASLTGESTPVLKTTRALAGKEVPLADRVNEVYMGTSVASGKAKALVVHTGMQTELGKIAGMVQAVAHETTPLQKKLEEFSKWLVYLCFVMVGMVFLLGWLRGGKIMEVFLTSVSLAVAAVPEGLPAVVTIALALGVHRMVKRNALIRKLPSVETLGCATVICSDKTGTLTKNEMTVQKVFAGGKLFEVTGIGYAPTGEFSSGKNQIHAAEDPDLQNLLRCGVLCNGAQLVKKADVYSIVGDPTEGALLTAAGKAGMTKEKEEIEYPFLDEIPFDSDRKKMTVIRKHGEQRVAFVKGAPDVLLDNCIYVEEKGVTRKLTDQDRAGIRKINNELTGEAMRVLAVASRKLDPGHEKYDVATVEKELVFAGLVAMIDPPREEVKKAMLECKAAGIKTVMITGDHKNTAVAIARALGFFYNDSMALSGEELDKLNDEALYKVVRKVSVYARVSPEHKLRVVRAWRKHGEIVAMTGDGVNDAPAVKEADIGVAMGITGTDVTKEVSDMVVTDDNFASIVSAVEEGRGIYDNIKKFIQYLLSCNAGEILVMFAASLVGLPAPLLPIHILWVNLVTDGLPALALGVDPVAPDIMKRPPRRSTEAVVTKDRALLILAQGSFIAFCSLLAFVFVLFIEKEGVVRARTAAFIVLACSQLVHSFNCRSTTESLFKLGVFTNKKLIFATAVSFLLQMAVVYLPFLQKVFKTEALGVLDWFLVLGISTFPLWAVEAWKAFLRNRKKVT